MKIILNLIHFSGNPLLGNDFMNDFRYSELQRFLCHHPWFKLDDVMIVSNDKGDENTDPRYRELKNMAKSVGFRWHETDYDTRIIELKEELERTYNYKFEARGENGEQHTTVIMGGCNLGGCVMNHHTLGAIQWAKQLYQTEVYVPMCAEYEQPGINGTQKMMKAVEVVYNEVKKHKDVDIWKSVDLVSEFHLLSIPQAEYGK